MLALCVPLGSAFVPSAWRSFRSNFGKQQDNAVVLQADQYDFRTDFDQPPKQPKQQQKPKPQTQQPPKPEKSTKPPTRSELQKEIESIQAQRQKLYDEIAEVNQRELTTQRSLESLPPDRFASFSAEDPGAASAAAAALLGGGAIAAGRSFLSDRDQVRTEATNTRQRKLLKRRTAAEMEGGRQQKPTKIFTKQARKTNAQEEAPQRGVSFSEVLL